MAKTVSIKLKPTQVKSIYKSFVFLITHYDVVSDHELLLLQHANEMTVELKGMVDKDAKTYTWKLTESKALAFMQLWKDDYRHLKEYEQKQILDINAMIDKARKTLKSTIYYEEAADH